MPGYNAETFAGGAACDAHAAQNEGVEVDVRQACAEHDVLLRRVMSTKTKDQTRPEMILLKCQHGLRNRRGRWALSQDCDGGLKPREVTHALEALHNVPINHVQFSMCQQRRSGGERPLDAPDVYNKVQAAAADGGVCDVRLDEERRMSHMFLQTAGQVLQCNCYGSVTMYDDTAVKNRYRVPIDVFVVVDGEYNTRIVGQSINANTTTDTFVWMLKAYLASRGCKQPPVFIQDADLAIPRAMREVFPDAENRRCLWHQQQSIIEAIFQFSARR